MPLKGWHPPNARPFAAEALTVTNAAAVSLVGPNGSLTMFDFAWIEVQDATLRMRVDGADPTTAVGHMWVAGQSDVLNFSEVQRLRAIAIAGNATIFASYYRNQ